jgi:enoyl-CoA hydratase
VAKLGSYTTLLVEQAARRMATVTLNRPHARNAINATMRDELVEVVPAMAARGVRAVVFTGSGKAFCSGADLELLRGRAAHVRAERDRLWHIYQAFMLLRRSELVTIAAVDGAAVGAGLNLALSCDLIVAGPSAKFCAGFTKVGLHPGGGASSMLVRAVGTQHALRMLLQNVVIDADEAVRIGLARVRVDDALGTAVEIGTQLALTDRDLLVEIKSSVYSALDLPFEAHLRQEAWAQAASSLRSEAGRQEA